MEILTLGCVESGAIILRTGNCEVIVSQGPKIVEQSLQTRANPGDVAYFDIEADYKSIANKPTDVDYFQWYRHDALTNAEIKLDDDNTYHGTKSSSLIIHPVLQKDYTFNGDYYYCQAFGACGNVYGSVNSDPIYLLPGDNLSVVLHPQVAAICPDDVASFVFEVWADGRDADVRYQWYLDGDAIENDAVFSGVTTGTLNVNLATTPAGVDVFGNYTCRA